MPLTPDKPEAMALVDLGDALSGFFDADWYVSRYPDVAASGTDPTHHYVHYGAAEGRDPNRFFDSAWYLAHYPDVAHSGQHPLLHYLQMGAAELRNPHPRFDAAYYVDQHPEAAANPLLHHLLFGVVRGWLTEKPIAIRDYLPSGEVSPAAPSDVVVDIVIPVYRGLAQTRRCIESVLADADRATRVEPDCPPGSTAWQLEDASNWCATGATGALSPRSTSASRHRASTTWCCSTATPKLPRDGSRGSPDTRMRHRAWPRSRRSPTTPRSAAIRASRAVRPRSGSAWPNWTPPATRRMPAARSSCRPRWGSACMSAAPHWPTSACSTPRRSAAATARRTISACGPARAAGVTCWPATPSSTTKAR
jgi:hypothetical protein